MTSDGKHIDKRPELVVEDLNVRFLTGGMPVDAVRNVSFRLGSEKLGVVGESGSGKSTLGRAILKLTPRMAEIRAKQLSFGDLDLLAASEAEMTRLRGKQMGMILQDPKYSLDPTMKVGEQIAEAVRLHRRERSRAARDYALHMLELVQIRNPARVYDLYPHEISGGMGQRVMIATTLVAEPRLIIADEPTSALDVTVRRQLLALLEQLVADRGIGLLFVTHDLDLAQGFCDRVLIMYAGQVLEDVAASALEEAQHPYTQGLLASRPRLDRKVDRLPVLKRDPAWRNAIQKGAAA